MLLTTTSTIEGRVIQEYKGIVFGEVVAGVDALKDMAAGFTNFFGGRSGSYEEELIGARKRPWQSWNGALPPLAPTPWWAWT